MKMVENMKVVKIINKPEKGNFTIGGIYKPLHEGVHNKCYYIKDDNCKGFYIWKGDVEVFNIELKK